jgi:hypothetical protein
VKTQGDLGDFEPFIRADLHRGSQRNPALNQAENAQQNRQDDRRFAGGCPDARPIAIAKASAPPASVRAASETLSAPPFWRRRPERKSFPERNHFAGLTDRV